MNLNNLIHNSQFIYNGQFDPILITLIILTLVIIPLLSAISEKMFSGQAGAAIPGAVLGVILAFIFFGMCCARVLQDLFRW